MLCRSCKIESKWPSQWQARPADCKQGPFQMSLRLVQNFLCLPYPFQLSIPKIAWASFSKPELQILHKNACRMALENAVEKQSAPALQLG